MRDVSSQADVAVVGRGPAGVASALALHRQGLSVVVVDRNVPRPLLGESLPPRAAPVLKELGLWADFLASGQAASYGNRSAWGSSSLVESDFIRSVHGHGWHLDHLWFDLVLTEALNTRNIRILSNTRLLACSAGAGRRWSLILSSGEGRRQLAVDVVIDATGRARQVARLFGARRLSHDRLMGMVGTLRPGQEGIDLDSFTEIEAVRDGWWYTAVLPDGLRVAGYMTDADSETGIIARKRGGWTMLLQQTTHLRERVATYGYTLEGPIRCVAADSSRLDRLVGGGWCAVGDAAGAFDPLSSQGIVTALESGQRAASAIGASARSGLRAYEAYMEDLYARYLAEWLTYYALESRWPNQPFWKRRHRALQELLR